ncbi:MAG TPA: hypothetical protein VIS78_07270, partial [Blastocatellia bacterium]
MRAKKIHTARLRLRPYARRAALVVASLLCLQAAGASVVSFGDEPEPASIVERKLDVFDFTLKTTDGRALDLRDYAR